MRLQVQGKKAGLFEKFDFFSANKIIPSQAEKSSNKKLEQVFC